VVDVLPVMCSGPHNTGNVCGAGTSPLRPGLNLRLGMRGRYKVRKGTWAVGTLTGRSRELAEVLKRRRVNGFVAFRKLNGKERKQQKQERAIKSGRTSTRNGVGVILDEEMKSKMVDV